MTWIPPSRSTNSLLKNNVSGLREQNGLVYGGLQPARSLLEFLRVRRYCGRGHRLTAVSPVFSEDKNGRNKNHPCPQRALARGRGFRDRRSGREAVRPCWTHQD